MTYACNVPIKRVVRKDASGTTSGLKKYLHVINEAEFEGTNWKALAEGSHNTKWPNEGSDPTIPAVLRGVGAH